MAKEKRLHAMWTENLETSVKVKELLEKVSADQTILNNKMEDGTEQQNQRMEKIRQLNEENMEKIAKTM